MSTENTETPGADEATGISAAEAADAFDQLLGGDADTGADEDGDDADEVEGLEADEAEGDDDDGEADEDDSQDAAASAKPELHRLKIDGQEVEVSIDELKKGYSLETAARQKLTAAAEQAKAVAAEIAGLDAFKGRLDTALAAIETGLQDPRYAAEEMGHLKDADPAEYAVRRLEMQDQADKAKALQADRDRIEAAQAHTAQEAKNAAITKEKTALLKAFPSWSDPEKAEAGLGKMADYAGKALGVSLQEFDAIEDHRVLVAIDKARLYDLIVAKGKTAGERVRSKAAPTITPGTTDARAPGQVQQSNALKRLQKTGSTRDAADAFSALL